ncbi:unnamed protein product [Paramecium sonneborni]|uniref:Protein kinase domain-containing protein n=1 Tax=Paramecium sonneborni TaxID=65129 RepID=A0A8S1QYI5_9CILI|nr:unnamed protein product [Paramecium sonneborni]
MGSIVCSNKNKTPPVYIYTDPGNLITMSEPQLNIKDNKDEYFDDEELLKYENTKYKQREVQNKPIKWQSLNHYLGQGSFGSVELGKDLESGQFIAVKQLSIKGYNPKQIKAKIDAFELEIKVLSKLEHPNIVKYLGMEQNQTHINLFLEHVSGGSIKSLLERYGQFPENLVQQYTKQILWGIEYLHSHGIIHRDIKGANILVDAKGICKLADFGSCKSLSKEDCNTFTGTPNWMAPEVIGGKGYGRFADIWSLGCTVIEMITGKPPWFDEAKNPFQIIMEIMKGQPPQLPQNLSEIAKDFLSHCLQYDPKKRLNITKLLQHPFVPKSGNYSISIDLSNMFKTFQRQIAQ